MLVQDLTATNHVIMSIFGILMVVDITNLCFVFEESWFFELACHIGGSDLAGTLVCAAVLRKPIHTGLRTIHRTIHVTCGAGETTHVEGGTASAATAHATTTHAVAVFFRVETVRAHHEGQVGRSALQRWGVHSELRHTRSKWGRATIKR